MQISIEFFGNQRLITKADSISMPISGKTTVNDALEYVRRQYPALPLDEEMILVTVNKKIATLDTVLRTRDTILFLPFISGG